MVWFWMDIGGEARGGWCWFLVRSNGDFVVVNGSFGGGAAVGFCGCACGG